MPRVLGVKSQRLVIEDPVSGSKITLHYRLPTSEERVAYQLAAYRLEGGERQFRLGEARLEFGLKILTGFEPGDFLVEEEGARVPLDPECHPDWKERLAAAAPDLISFLSQQVFEGLRVAARGAERD